jgi:hypothetical protein
MCVYEYMLLMYVIDFICRDKIDFAIFLWVCWVVLGSFRISARSAQQSIENSVRKRKECVYAFYFEFRGECAR